MATRKPARTQRSLCRDGVRSALSGVTLKTDHDVLVWAVLAAGAYASLGYTHTKRQDGDEDVATASEVADDLMREVRRRRR